MVLVLFLLLMLKLVLVVLFHTVLVSGGKWKVIYWSDETAVQER